VQIQDSIDAGKKDLVNEREEGCPGAHPVDAVRISLVPQDAFHGIVADMHPCATWVHAGNNAELATLHLDATIF
jgi:hypothetical protein